MKCTECKHQPICRLRSIMKGSAFCDRIRGLMKFDKKNRWNKFKALLGR